MRKRWIPAIVAISVGAVVSALVVAFVESNIVGRVNPITYYMAPVFGLAIAIVAIVIETTRAIMTSRYLPLTFLAFVGAAYVPFMLLSYIVWAVGLSNANVLLVVCGLAFNPINCYLAYFYVFPTAERVHA